MTNGLYVDGNTETAILEKLIRVFAKSRQAAGVAEMTEMAAWLDGACSVANEALNETNTLGMLYEAAVPLGPIPRVAKGTGKYWAWECDVLDGVRDLLRKSRANREEAKRRA